VRRVATSATVRSGTSLPPRSGRAVAAAVRCTHAWVGVARGESWHPTRPLSGEGRPGGWHERHHRLEAAAAQCSAPPVSSTWRWPSPGLDPHIVPTCRWPTRAGR
jgi:hypothetical protein